MAIKVAGQAPEAVQRTTCYNCGSILEFTRNDTRRVSEPEIGGVDVYNAIDCPTCNKTLRV